MPVRSENTLGLKNWTECPRKIFVEELLLNFVAESRDRAIRCRVLLASRACSRGCAALACPQTCREPILNPPRARVPVECQPGHR